MPLIILNAILSILGMISASNFSSAFGTHAVPEFVVIAAIIAAVLAQPMTASTIAFMFVAFTADLLSSGPPGVPAFLGIIAYLLIRAMTLRIQPQRIISICIFALIATFIYHAALAAVYTLFYKDAPFFSIYIVNDWKNALLSAIFAPIMLWLTNVVGSLFEKRKKGKLVV